MQIKVEDADKIRGHRTLYGVYRWKRGSCRKYFYTTLTEATKMYDSLCKKKTEDDVINLYKYPKDEELVFTTHKSTGYGTYRDISDKK